jgi:hypothetical protein
MSYRQLKKVKKQDIINKDWIMDSGAFQELYVNSKYTYSINDYLECVKKFNPTIFVNMDYMCEPFMLKKINSTVRKNQLLTIDNHIKIKDKLDKENIKSKFMGVIQGWDVNDYLEHIDDYKSYGLIEEHMGIGSICRRTEIENIADIIKCIKKELPNVKLHGFGIKLHTFKTHPELIKMLYSADSMAWSFYGRMNPLKTSNDSRCKINNETCIHLTNKNCANCHLYMLYWYRKVLNLIKEWERYDLCRYTTLELGEEIKFDFADDEIVFNFE